MLSEKNYRYQNKKKSLFLWMQESFRNEGMGFMLQKQTQRMLTTPTRKEISLFDVRTTKEYHLNTKHLSTFRFSLK